ncbi:MAG: SBBP repeat-containing protein [Acidobacteria bacterium]|nr:SBBP repeat-containing protein [Acidobacteriota bacterium]
MKLVGAGDAPEAVGVGELPGKSNYLRGSDPAAWRTGVASFSGVEYRGVYDGIDLVYYGNQRQLEYDFRLAPGADPRRVRLGFEGQTSLRVDAGGDLVLGAPGGGEVRQQKPYAYQEEADGRRVEVASRYVLKGKGRVGFEVGAYDTARPLVIDPVLAYSTYLGGGGSNDTARGVAVDAAGNAYVTGETISTDFPATAGAAQTTFGGFNYDAYVTKLNAAGTAVVYSTFLGGSRNDNGYAVAVDAAGDAYVVGSTASLGFPTTAGAFQTARNGQGDGFVSKIHVGDDEPTYRIRGRVTGGDGSPLAGVDINIFGGARARPKTAADGTYLFGGLRVGVDYSLTAYSPCVSFTTQNDTVNNLSSDQAVDSTGAVVTFSVGGRVTVSNKPDEGYGGVTMKLAGGQTLTTRTDGQGNYSFPAVAGCRDYTLTASASNISFDPPSRSYTYLSQNQSFADFAAAAPQLMNYAPGSSRTTGTSGGR